MWNINAPFVWGWGSDSLFDSRRKVFGVKLYNEDIPEIEGLRDVAMATNFGTKIAITGY